MERTISGMMGKGSVNHNTRAFSAKNVDKERSRDNVEFCHSDIKEVYHNLFDEALERYNAKQKRSDRKIDDYYEKIRRGKQEKLFYEVIFQIGNKDDMNVQSNEGQLAKDILCEFMEQFQKRNPNLFVFSSHLHMDVIWSKVLSVYYVHSVQKEGKNETLYTNEMRIVYDAVKAGFLNIEFCKSVFSGFGRYNCEEGKVMLLYKIRVLG